MKILVINGPNINLLGYRDEKTYGKGNYGELLAKIEEESSLLNMETDVYQSNCEGEIVSKIQEIILNRSYDGLLINPGAYTHYSIAIRDSLEMLDIPIVEVHLSNILDRENFRKESIISSVCTGSIVGMGIYGYILGLRGLYMKIESGR